MCEHSLAFTRDQIVKVIKEWVESHNPEYKWDWKNLADVRKEMIACARISGTCEIQDLLNHFASS